MVTFKPIKVCILVTSLWIGVLFKSNRIKIGTLELPVLNDFAELQ